LLLRNVEIGESLVYACHYIPLLPSRKDDLPKDDGFLRMILHPIRFRSIQSIPFFLPISDHAERMAPGGFWWHGMSENERRGLEENLRLCWLK
jgi:hypothetical protein